MEKLVITYYLGDFDKGHYEVVCLDYESAEAFCVHLNDAVEKFAKDSDENTVLHSKWWEKYHKYMKTAPKNGRPFAEIEARPESIHQEIKIGNKTFLLYDFRKVKESGEWEIVMPTVQTLEEWYQSKAGD